MWTGAMLSSVGTWMQQLAQSWLIYDITGSARMLGLDAFLGQAPIMILSLVGGVIADRIDRRHILLASQVVQLACAFLLSGLYVAGIVQRHPYLILLLSFTVGTAQAFGGPAYQAFVPTLVPTEHLPNAIALNSIQFNTGRILGPSIGGIVLAKLGAGWCFALNGVSYLAVILTLLLVRPRFTPKATRETMMESMRKGMSFVRERSVIVSLMALAFFLTFLGGPTITFLPVFAKLLATPTFGDAQTQAWLMVASGAGSVVGALVVATLSHSHNKGRIAVINMLVLGAMVLGFSQSKTFSISAALLFVGSGALMSVFTLVNSLVQLQVTDEMRGRVMSVYNMAFRGGMPVGNYVSGEAIERVGLPGMVIGANAVLMMLTAIYFYFFRRKVSEL